MRLLLIAFIALVFSGCDDSKLEEVPYEEYVSLMMKDLLPPPSEVVIKDEHGNVIDVDSFSVLQRKYDFYDQFYRNKEGAIVEYQLVKKPEFRDLPVDCERAGVVLDSLYTIDQSIRRNYDPRQDYANLEMVHNITQKCGMPTMIASTTALFMIVQHNHVSHQKNFIERFRKAAQDGLLSKSTLALMEDRILVSEGKPQLYGTQVRRGSRDEPWELYEIIDPEKVNQRRREMGMIPIEDYLNNFGIVFDVEQVE